MKHRIVFAATVAAALLAPIATGAAQSPMITQQGDPSVKSDSIYRLAVKAEDHPEETAAYLLDAKGRYTMDAGAEAKLKSVIAGAKTSDDSVRAIQMWVAQDVRCVAIALGMGG